MLYHSESSKPVRQKSRSRWSGRPHQLNFHVPSRLATYGDSGISSVSADSTDPSGSEYALAGSTLT